MGFSRPYYSLHDRSGVLSGGFLNGTLIQRLTKPGGAGISRLRSLGSEVW